ncbi:DUF6069 family protein [Streptosporangium sp. CA-135522]|uniref:DUF6069 family protein n=1 Tax=Streptosporangium sp. CA-135522 TaxID=3240072 RepID=UPI003D92D077
MSDKTMLTRAAGRRALVVAGAMAAALALWALAGPLAELNLAVRIGGELQLVGLVSVAAASLIAGLAGWALLAALERRSARPRRTWTIIAVIVLVLSLAGPIGSAAGTPSMVVLAGMHLLVAAVLIPGLGGSATVRRRPGTGDLRRG